MWFNNIRKQLPFVQTPHTKKAAQKSLSRFYIDNNNVEEEISSSTYPTLLQVPLEKAGKCSSEIDLARASALASLTPTVRSRTNSASQDFKETSLKQHSRSKSTGGGSWFDDRQQTALSKSNSLPRSSSASPLPDPMLKKASPHHETLRKKVVQKAATSLPKHYTLVSPSLGGVTPMSSIFSRLAYYFRSGSQNESSSMNM